MTGPVWSEQERTACATLPPPGMLAAGGSLDEIGQVLRHQRRDTTAIYANPRKFRQTRDKVQVAWPGRVRNRDRWAVFHGL